VSYLTATPSRHRARIRDFLCWRRDFSPHRRRGNVVGVLEGAMPRTGAHGSHYDTVINAGKYDGRLGVVLPNRRRGLVRRSGLRLPFRSKSWALQRKKACASSRRSWAAAPSPDASSPTVLDSTDQAGVSLREANRRRRSRRAAIPGIARDPAEVGASSRCTSNKAVLLEREPVGVVTSIAGAGAACCRSPHARSRGHGADVAAA